MQSCELQTRLLEGSLEEQRFLGHIYLFLAPKLHALSHMVSPLCRWLAIKSLINLFLPNLGFGRLVIHHSNDEHPVGGTKIRHAEGPVPAAGTALSTYYLLPPHACWRNRLLVSGPWSGRQRAAGLPPSRPPPAKHNAANEYLGLVERAENGAPRACANWTAPSSGQ